MEKPEDTCQMQMRASACRNSPEGRDCWRLTSILPLPDAADDSGNCISWLSRALRTFARTLTMDSHAGTGRLLGFGRYCFQML